MSAEKTIRVTADLIAVLDNISFKPSCVNMGWRWKVLTMGPIASVLPAQPSNILGWLISTTFRRPDTDTGIIGEGEGRKEFIAAGTTVSGVVKTCWLLVELIVRHELMESFCWKGERVFDPHKTIEALTRNEPRRNTK